MNSASIEIGRRLTLTALTLGLASTLVPGAASANQSGVPVPVAPSFPKQDPKRYGLALAEYADRYDSGWVDQYSKGTMVLFDARGDKVERQFAQTVLEGTVGDKSIVRFLLPAEIRGVAALIHEHPRATDDSWLYLPASRRVRRISGANRSASFQGTEFTYEDLSGFSVERYDWRYLRDATVNGEPVYLLEARPRYADSAYSRLEIALHRTHYRGERAVFYDLAGRKLKTLTQTRWQQVHERFWRPLRLDMTNHQTHKRTLLEVRSLFVNLSLYPKSDGRQRQNLTEEQFTERALQTG